MDLQNLFAYKYVCIHMYVQVKFPVLELVYQYVDISTGRSGMIHAHTNKKQHFMNHWTVSYQGIHK